MSAPVKPLITIDDLNKIDVRVGTILEANPVARSNTLVQLIADFGDFQRSILCGIKQERPELESIIGKQALFVVNLAPKKISGVISEGSLYDLGYPDGIVPSALAQPERPVPNGTRAG